MSHPGVNEFSKLSQSTASILIQLLTTLELPIDARITALFSLCSISTRTDVLNAFTSADVFNIAWLNSQRFHPSTSPMSLFACFRTAFPSIQPTSPNFSQLEQQVDVSSEEDPYEKSILSSMDDVIVSAFLTPRLRSEIGRISARQFCMLVGPAFSFPPQLDSSTANLLEQHSHLCAIARSLLSVTRSERDSLNSLLSISITQRLDDSQQAHASSATAPQRHVNSSIPSSASNAAVPSSPTPQSNNRQLPIANIKFSPSSFGVDFVPPISIITIAPNSEPPIRPAFFRFAPEICAVDSDEFFLQDFEPTHELLWMPDLHSSSFDNTIARDLLLRAFQSPLTPQQIQSLVQQLDSDPNLIVKCDILPAHFPDLVENNPSIAVEFLNRINNSSSAVQTEAYLATLLSMPLSLHSMEVVNRLTSSSPSPAIVSPSSASTSTMSSTSSASSSCSDPLSLSPDFLHRYISHCIQSCDSMRDKYLQARLVRLVCVFVTSLIQHQRIRVADLFAEIQTFCLAFARMREAAMLFRLLKAENSLSLPL